MRSSFKIQKRNRRMNSAPDDIVQIQRSGISRLNKSIKSVNKALKKVIIDGTTYSISQLLNLRFDRSGLFSKSGFSKQSTVSFTSGQK